MADKTDSHDSRLQRIVNERHAVAWNSPKDQDKRDTLGMVVASFYGHAFEDIAVAFLSALEDANAHTECGHITDYLKERGWNLEKQPAGNG